VPVRIVLDTNILVRANPRVSPEGLARELLLTIVFGPHELVLSTWILTEVRRVLNYPHVRKRWPLTEEEMGNYLSALQEAAFLVELPESLPAVVSDPDDDPILQTAILGQADVLCTRDAAFDHSAVRDVCGTHAIRILDDIALIHQLRSSPDS
jgi:putative PIN family toxin of toxin-antitoxin system